MNKLLTLLSTALLIGLLVPAQNAWGDRAHEKYRGKVLLSDVPYPYSYGGTKEQLKYLKKHQQREFARGAKETWTIEYMAFLKTKLEARKAVIIFFDITDDDSPPEEVYSTGYHPDDPHTKVIIDHVKLSEEFFAAERYYEMQISRGRGTKPLATARFVLRN